MCYADWILALLQLGYEFPVKVSRYVLSIYPLEISYFICDEIVTKIKIEYTIIVIICSNSTEGKHHFNSATIRSIAEKDILRRRNRIMQLGRLINETLEAHQEKNLKMNNIQKYSNRSVYEYNPSCDSNAMLTFASADAHDGPRTDISYVLLNMNQKFLHIGPRNATKNYPQGS